MAGMRVCVFALLFVSASADAHGDADPDACAAGDSACEACKTEMDKINVTCPTTKKMDSDPSAENLAALAKELCEAGSCKDYIDATATTCKGTSKEMDVTRVQELCDTASCYYAVVQVPFTCPVQEDQDVTTEILTGMCAGGGACKTLIDDAVTKCDADGEMKMGMQKFQQMCHPCMMGMVEATENCMINGEEFDPTKMCSDACKATMKKFEDNMCADWVPDRRLAKAASEQSKAISPGRRLGAHEAAEMKQEMTPGEAIAAMMMFVEQSCMCLQEVAKVESECPAVDDKTGEDTDKVKQLCEPGACKTAVDGAMSSCMGAQSNPAHQPVDGVQNFNQTMTVLDRVCALVPCMGALAEIPNSCPGMDKMGDAKPTSDMLAMICDAGDCKTQLDTATQTCSGQSDMTAKDFMDQVPMLNMMCTECMKSMVTIPDKCPSMAHEDVKLSEAMLAEICDPGDCKTQLDHTKEHCNEMMEQAAKDDHGGDDSDDEDDGIKEMMMEMMGLDAMCTDCMRHMVKAIGVCGVPQGDDDTELSKDVVCADECQGHLKEMQEQKCFEDDRRLSDPMFAKLKLKADKIFGPRRLGGHESKEDSMENMVTMLVDMCNENNCPGAMMGLMTSCPALIAEGEAMGKGAQPSEQLMTELCEPGDCHDTIGKVGAACKDDPNGQGMGMMLMMCEPCYKHMMEAQSVCQIPNSEDQDMNMEVFCGTECSTLMQTMKTEKCDEKIDEMMGGEHDGGHDRRLSGIRAGLETFTKFTRRLGGHEGGDDEHSEKPGDRVKMLYEMNEEGCTACGKAAMATGMKACMDDNDHPDPTKSVACETLVCKIGTDCPKNPEKSPIMGVPLDEYNAVMTKIEPPCAARTTIPAATTLAPTTVPAEEEAVSGASRTFGATVFFGTVAALVAA